MQGILKKGVNKWAGIVMAFMLLLVSLALSVLLGLTDITIQTVIEAYSSYQGTNEQVIVRQARVPRALIAACVGGSLAMAGALMQGLTRNPLASPNILGIHSGASFAIVLAVTLFGVPSLQAFAWLAFLGAALTGAFVYFLGAVGQEQMTPIKLTLAGAAMAAFFSSLTQGMLVLNEQTLDVVMFWLVGSVQGRDLALLVHVLPYFFVGWLMALLLGKKMNTMMLGDDVARGLGQKTWLVKILAGVAVILLAGGSVAVAGPIGFIGIVIPHVARWLVGGDFRWLLPYSAILGAILLLLADVAARYVIMPSEVPVGIMTAAIGTPFFIYIARKGEFSS